jgi:hypothetical protein
MFSATAVIIAFVTGAAFGVACFALAIRLGRDPEDDPEATVPAEFPQPKQHRPIAATSFGPEAPLRAPPASSHPGHRPISGG